LGKLGPAKEGKHDCTSVDLKSASRCGGKDKNPKNTTKKTKEKNHQDTASELCCGLLPHKSGKDKCRTFYQKRLQKPGSKKQLREGTVGQIAAEIHPIRTTGHDGKKWRETGGRDSEKEKGGSRGNRIAQVESGPGEEIFGPTILERATNESGVASGAGKNLI